MGGRARRFGLAQGIGSLGRIIGPLAAGWLFLTVRRERAVPRGRYADGGGAAGRAPSVRAILSAFTVTDYRSGRPCAGRGCHLRYAGADWRAGTQVDMLAHKGEGIGYAHLFARRSHWRLAGVAAGAVFWFEHLNNLRSGLTQLHMTLGILVVLALWVLATIYARTPNANLGMAIGASVIGLLLLIVGVTQQGLLLDGSTGSSRWHPLSCSALTVIGMGEMLDRRDPPARPPSPSRDSSESGEGEMGLDANTAPGGEVTSCASRESALPASVCPASG